LSVLFSFSALWSYGFFIFSLTFFFFTLKFLILLRTRFSGEGSTKPGHNPPTPLDNDPSVGFPSYVVSQESSLYKLQLPWPLPPVKFYFVKPPPIRVTAICSRRDSTISGREMGFKPQANFHGVLPFYFSIFSFFWPVDFCERFFPGFPQCHPVFWTGIFPTFVSNR